MFFFFGYICRMRWRQTSGGITTHILYTFCLASPIRYSIRFIYYETTYVMLDFRLVIDFHWAISYLVGGRSSCRDESPNDLTWSAVFAEIISIGSSCMQKPSSASSESTGAVDDDPSSSLSTSATAESASPSGDNSNLCLAPNVWSSDNTNRLEFRRCCNMSRAVATISYDDVNSY